MAKRLSLPHLSGSIGEQDPVESSLRAEAAVALLLASGLASVSVPAAAAAALASSGECLRFRREPPRVDEDAVRDSPSEESVVTPPQEPEERQVGMNNRMGSSQVQKNYNEYFSLERQHV